MSVTGLGCLVELETVVTQGNFESATALAIHVLTALWYCGSLYALIQVRCRHSALGGRA